MTRRTFSPRSILLFLASFLAFVSIACGSTAPTTSPTAVVEIPATPTAESLIPENGGSDEATPALLEFRRLTLEYPPTMKLGSGSDVIILTLEVDAQGNITPTAQIDGNVTQGEIVEIPNLYETHNVTAEAYYEVTGLNVTPKGSTFQPLKQGERIRFTWSVQPQDVGTYGGTIFLFLNFENRETGEKDRKEISIQIFDIKVVDFFGFSTNFVKTSGVVGSVLGVIVGFPFFDDIVKYLFGRLTSDKRKQAKSKKKK